ncbi:MAG TPA: hypothetical protein PK156_27655 [Polyangium sp.]|nr:hypothetical protein [Polyangium sp.]
MSTRPRASSAKSTNNSLGNRRIILDEKCAWDAMRRDLHVASLPALRMEREVFSNREIPFRRTFLGRLIGGKRYVVDGYRAQQHQDVFAPMTRFCHGQRMPAP